MFWIFQMFRELTFWIDIMCASLKDKCLVYFHRLWKDVTKCLKEDDVESATGFKHKVFSQRQDSSFSQSQYAQKF